MQTEEKHANRRETCKQKRHMQTYGNQVTVSNCRFIFLTWVVDQRELNQCIILCWQKNKSKKLFFQGWHWCPEAREDRCPSARGHLVVLKPQAEYECWFVKHTMQGHELFPKHEPCSCPPRSFSGQPANMQTTTQFVKIFKKMNHISPHYLLTASSIAPACSWGGRCPKCKQCKQV